MFKTFDLL